MTQLRVNYVGLVEHVWLMIPHGHSDKCVCLCVCVHKCSKVLGLSQEPRLRKCTS